MLADVTVGVYARISLDRSGDEIGVTNQLRAGCDLCRQRGWADPATFADDDISATHGAHRPAYAQLLAAIERGEIATVVVFHLSRLWRNRRERAEGIDVMRRHGVNIVCVRGPSLDMSTAYGRAMAGLLGEFDTMEVEIKSERHLLAHAARAEKGLPSIGGHRAFGYTPDGLAVVEEEALAIRAGADAVLAGASLAQVAREWNAAGLRTARAGNLWRFHTVRLVMLNPRNAGIRAHRGKEIGPAVWPAILPEPTFRAVVATLTHPDRHAGGARAGMRLLTGIAVCGVPGCGLAVHGGSANRGGATYRCPSQRHFSRLAGPVDEWVVEHIVARLEREDAGELLVDRDRPDVDALREQAAGLRARIAATKREFTGSDEMTPAELRTLLADMRGRLVAVQDRMADAGRADLLGPLISAPDVRAAWEAYDRARQRLVVDMLVSVVVWPPGRGARRFDPATVEVRPKA